MRDRSAMDRSSA